MQAVVQSLPKGRYTLPLRNAMVNVDVMGWLSRPVSLYQTVYDMFYILMKGRLGRRIVLERKNGMVKGICPVDADEGCQARIGMIEQILDNEFGKDLALAGIIDGEMVEDSTLMDKFISQAKATAEQYESDATKAEKLSNSFWSHRTSWAGRGTSGHVANSHTRGASTCSSGYGKGGVFLCRAPKVCASGILM